MVPGLGLRYRVIWWGCYVGFRGVCREAGMGVRGRSYRFWREGKGCCL